MKIDYYRETDGRWIADVLDIPGCFCYGRTKLEATLTVKRLVHEVLAGYYERGETPPCIDKTFIPLEKTA